MMYPKWATPERRAQLVRLLVQGMANGPCLLGHGDNCPHREAQEELRALAPQVLGALFGFGMTPEEEAQLNKVLQRALAHSYEVLSEEVIADWKAYDRVERERAWKREQRRLHAAPQIKKRGEFDSIRREQYLAQRPVWHIVAIGLNALTFKRVAQVEIPGLKRTIWVDVSGINLEGVKRHKLAHYKRGSLPKGLVEQVEQRVQAQVAKVL